VKQALEEGTSSFANRSLPRGSRRHKPGATGSGDLPGPGAADARNARNSFVL